MADYSFLQTLEDIIKQQKDNDPQKSYTAKLCNKGLNKVTQKFGEESVEVVIAALNETNERLVSEISDLLYHLFVLMEKKEIPFEEVIDELKKRNIEKNGIK